MFSKVGPYLHSPYQHIQVLLSVHTIKYTASFSFEDQSCRERQTAPNSLAHSSNVHNHCAGLQLKLEISSRFLTRVIGAQSLQLSSLSQDNSTRKLESEQGCAKADQPTSVLY